MRGWLKANGGPLAIVVVGLGVLSLSVPVGVALIAIGTAGFVLTLGSVQRRIPWTIVRKNTVATRRTSEQELGRRCLALSVNRIAERHAEFIQTDPRKLNWGLLMPSPKHSRMGSTGTSRE